MAFDPVAEPLGVSGHRCRLSVSGRLSQCRNSDETTRVVRATRCCPRRSGRCLRRPATNRRHRRRRRRAPDGPIVESVEEKLEYVANGDCIAILPASAADRYLRDDVRGVPIHDIAPATVAIATRYEHHPPMLAAFIRALSRTSQSDLNAGENRLAVAPADGGGFQATDESSTAFRTCRC